MFSAWVKAGNCLFVFIGLIVALQSGSVYAQNKVVVVPLIGEDGPQFKGPWTSGTEYRKSDVVEEGGSSYIAITNHQADLSNIPPDINFWGLVAASGTTGEKGDQGEPGPPGDEGAKGDPGPPGAPGEQGVMGDQGLQGVQGDQGIQGLQGDEGIQGLQGDQGLTGPAGAVGAMGPSLYDACVDINGNHGVVINNVCLLSYNGTSGASGGSDWAEATQACALKGGDLCSVSQYAMLRALDDDFYANRPVWSDDFSDNDGNTKLEFLRSSDDPIPTQLYGYGCCGNLQANPFRTSAQDILGVSVSWIQNKEDTNFRVAARICTSLGADLCTKSQYSILRGNGVTVERVWSSDMSDNDHVGGVGTFDLILSDRTTDNPIQTTLSGFACCSSDRPLDYSCPGGTLLSDTGICVMETHAQEDSNFFEAATACASMSSDICSKSQTTIVRNKIAALADVQMWTNDGADNDNGQVGGLLGTQLNNPDPSTTEMGYACCR